MTMTCIGCQTGWITGHSYLTYGPFLCGATNVIYEGVPAHPKPNRIWQVRATNHGNNKPY